MKPVLFRSLVLSVFILLIFNLILYAQGSISVTSPSGGENWDFGSTHDITWESPGITNVKIEFSTNDGVNWQTIIASCPGTAKKNSWVIPAPNKEKCLVKISDVSDLTVFGVSNSTFSIVTPLPPNITAPLDGAVSISTTAVTFTWDPIIGPSGTQYHILISENGNFESTLIDKTTDKTSYQYTSPTLKNNTIYYWRIRAEINGSPTSYSTTRSFKTKLVAPVLSSPDDKSELQTDEVTLAWEKVEDADTYTLEVSASNNFSSILPDLTGLNSISRLLTGLTENQLYYWRVKSVQTDGNTSDYSSTRTFTTRHAKPSLKYPTNHNSLKLTKIEYQWDDVLGASSYELQVCKSNTFDTPDLKNYPDTSIYTPSNFYLKYNTKYFWRVRAKIGSSYSLYSDTWDFNIDSPKTSIPLNDLNAGIVFDHENGRISQITYKSALDNSQLLNIILNDNSHGKTGLGRVNSETNTKLVSWNENAGNYEYNYENPLYGSKKLTIKWGVTGITVDMALNLDANKTAVVNAAWQPGGDNGPIHDYILFNGAIDTLTKVNLTYPGITSKIYDKTSTFVAMFDDRIDKFFGYKNSEAVQTLIQQGPAILGPAFTYKTGSTSQVFNLEFAIKNKSDFFTWASKNYIWVTSPAKSDCFIDNSSMTVKWERFGTPSLVDIFLSTDGGLTFLDTKLKDAIDDDGEELVTLPNLSINTPLDNCVIKVSGNGITGISKPFSIISKSSTIFSIDDNLIGSPTASVDIPVKISPAINAGVSAFDVRVEYDKDKLTFVNKKYEPILDKWTLDATNNPNLGYVQVGGFNNGGSAVPNSDAKLFTLTFNVKSTDRVGTQIPLKINNSYLSAANTSATKLSVAGKNGLLTLYSRISGYLRYIINKKPIFGNNIVTYSTNAKNIQNATKSTNSAGFYDFFDIIPGSEVTITPNSTLTMTGAVDAIDAAKAFAGREGGSTVLLDIQKIAADVNSDGIVNSTDALAILQLSTGNIASSSWLFVDSTFKITSSNWASAPHIKIYSPLDTVRANQSYWGMILGDVDGDYVPPTSQNMPAFAPSPKSIDISAAVFSVPSDLKGRPGDTLYLPLAVNLNGNNIGAFNTSLQLDKNLFTYCGKYNEGASFPADKGWTLSAHFDSTGKLNVGATDFSGSLDPIIKDGTVAVFKFIVNSSAKLGDTCQVMLSGLSVADSKLAPVTVNTKNGKVTITNATSVEKNVVINDYSVAQNYPNPFNPSTTIEYALPAESKVDIEIFNSIGQKIADLFHGTQSFGYHKVEWNAKSMASGIYFYSIKATSLSSGKDFKSIKKMILMK